MEFPYFIDSTTLILRKPSCLLWDFEAKELSKEAEKLGLKFEIEPLQVVFDLKNNKTLVLKWTTLGQVCPFISKENKCLVYENRPLKCREFPLTTNIMQGLLQTGKIIVYHSFCPNKLSDQEERMVIDKFCENRDLKELQETYGDCLKAHIEEWHIYDLIFRRLAEEDLKREIKLARQGYDLKFLMKRIKSSKIEPFEFNEEIVKIIKSFGFANKFLNEFTFQKNTN